MEGQALFNIAVGVAGALGGWVLRTLWESVLELQLAMPYAVTVTRQ